MERSKLTDIIIHFDYYSEHTIRFDDGYDRVNVSFTYKYDNNDKKIHNETIKDPILFNDDENVEVCLRMHGDNIYTKSSPYNKKEKKKMTIEEIENKLGYGIEIVSKN